MMTKWDGRPSSGRDVEGWHMLGAIQDGRNPMNFVAKWVPQKEDRPAHWVSYGINGNFKFTSENLHLIKDISFIWVGRMVFAEEGNTDD